MDIIQEALDCMERVCEITMDISNDYIELLWQEIEHTPDDTPITVSAGALKSLFRTYNAMESYIMNDMDGVRHYLETKNLI